MPARLGTLLLGAVLILAFAPHAGRAVAADKINIDEDSNQARLQGTWDVLEFLDDGHRFEVDGIATTLTVDGATFRMDYWKGKDKLGELEFTVRFAREPSNAIDLVRTDKGEVKESLGIFELQGESLKLCISHAGNKNRPTKYSSLEKSRTSLVTLRRAKP